MGIGAVYGENYRS